MVAAKNVHGWGPNSTQTAVQATNTDVPDAPTNVQTAVSTDSLGIVVTWDPYVDNGLAVTAVQVYIEYHTPGTYAIDTASCDGTSGTNAATIVSSRTCTIPMTDLRGAPWNLVLSDYVVAHVLAMNADGWSTASSDSTGGA